MQLRSARPLLSFVAFKRSLAVWVAAGLVLRLVLIIRSGWRIDYDEAMIGLLGLRVIRGEWMAFIPAQATLGALEPYLLALPFGIFGVNIVSFRLLSLTMSAAYIVTIGLVARYAFDERVGMIAALLAAIAPPYMTVTGLKTWGGTVETIVLGNCLLLLVADAIDRNDSDRSQRNRFVLAGFVAGIMFWLAWLCFYYLLPATLILIWRGRAALRRHWPPLLGAFLTGSLPFWIVNLRESFPTFTQVLGGRPMTLADIGAVLAHFGNDLMSRLVTGDPAWQVSGSYGQFALGVLYYAGAVGLLLWNRRGPWRQQGGVSLRWMLAVFVVMLPIIYVVSGYGRNALNLWKVDAAGRYVLMLHTALPIGLAALSVAIGGMHLSGARWIGIGTIALSVGLNVLGAVRLDTIQAFDSPYYGRLPGTLSPLIAYLDEHGIRHVWTDVGIAQVLTFETGERILAADYYDVYIAGGLVRFPDILAAVKAANKTAFVVPLLPDQQNPPIERALNAAGISYTATRVTPALAVYVPNQTIDPALIAPGLGYQY